MNACQWEKRPGLASANEDEGNEKTIMKVILVKPLDGSPEPADGEEE